MEKSSPLNICITHQDPLKYYCINPTCKSLLCELCFKIHPHKKKSNFLFEDLLNNYEIKEYLGNGAYGQVFSVVKNFESYALKYIDIEVFREDEQSNEKKEDFLKKIEREASFLKNIRHPFIINYYDHYIIESEDSLVIKMELMEKNLLLYVNENKCDNSELLQIFSKICSGVNYLHEKNILHRDLKLGNILIKNGIPKICDFGVAQQLSEKTSKFTTKNLFLGTQLYLAPEIYNLEFKI